MFEDEFSMNLIIEIGNLFRPRVGKPAEEDFPSWELESDSFTGDDADKIDVSTCSAFLESVFSLTPLPR